MILNLSNPVLDVCTVEGWKAELDSVVGYTMKWFTCPQTVTQRGSNHGWH